MGSRLFVFSMLFALSTQASVPTVPTSCYVEEFTKRYTCEFANEFSASHTDGKSEQDVKQIILTQKDSEIPLDLFTKFPNTEVFKLNKLGLKQFNGKSLQGAAKLKELYLAGNELSAIEPHSFASAPNLVYLDLSSNKLTDLKDHTFAGVPNLIFLELANNQFDHLDAKYFADIPDVKVIELGNNKVKALTKDIFSNNPSLRGVRLSRNNINYIDPEFFDNIPYRCKVQLWKNDCIHNGYMPSRGPTIGPKEEFFDIVAKKCSTK